MQNQYVTGAVIKELREKNHLTQAELGEKLGVCDKAVSKWETGRGYPDISLLESIADTFGISITELISGNTEGRFKISGVKKIFAYCKWDGLFCVDVSTLNH